MLHGVARRSSVSASGVMCRRTSSRSAWKPPVARTTGVSSRQLAERLAEAGAHRRGGRGPRSAIACRSARRSSRVARVARSTTAAPRRSSQAEVVVEPLVDEPLQLRVAARALRRKSLEVAVAPDDAAREQHRPAGAVALLVHDDVGAALASPRAAATRPAMPAPATTRSGITAQTSEKPGLCSTYSSLIRSGPQTKTASVFAASTTSAISRPRGRASSSTSSA